MHIIDSKGKKRDFMIDERMVLAAKEGAIVPFTFMIDVDRALTIYIDNNLKVRGQFESYVNAAKTEEERIKEHEELFNSSVLTILHKYDQELKELERNQAEKRNNNITSLIT